VQTTPILSQHTFGQQSAAWISELQSRKRKPVAPSTLHAFNSYVRRLLPIIGPDTPLSNIDNGFVRDLVTKLVGEKLSAKTISELVATTKQIVSSAVDSNGNHLFPRQWNSKFIDMPQIANQKTPCATRVDVERCIKNSRNDQERLLYAVLASTGLRISEVLSVHTAGNDDQTTWDKNSAALHVKTSIYRGKEHNRVKTAAATRSVDLDPRLNDLIGAFVAENSIQPGQYLFQSRTGQAMNLKTATDRLKKHGVRGFHAFRRFRITRLRERAIPEDLVRYWAGHAGESISDRYSKLAENVELRKKYAGPDEAGLGFDIRLAGITGHPEPDPTKPPKSRKPQKSELRTQLVSEIADPYTVPYQATDDDLDPVFFAPLQEQV
jgi:integrase